MGIFQFVKGLKKQPSKETVVPVPERHCVIEQWDGIWGKNLSIKVGALNASECTDELAGAVYEYLQNNQELVLNSILIALHERYDLWRVEYADDFYDEEEYMKQMPVIKTPDELIKLIEPEELLITPVCIEGSYPYGIVFDCTWEPHGLGVMLYKTKVLNVGSWEAAAEWGLYEKEFRTAIVEDFG